MSDPVIELFDIDSVTSDSRPWSPGRTVKICTGCGVMERVVLPIAQEKFAQVYEEYEMFSQSQADQINFTGIPEGRTKKILKFIANKIPAPKSILDIGSGNGAGLKALSEQFTKRNFLLGVSIWGDQYINLFTKYCLPSLLASGNVPFLCERRNVILNINTNIEGYYKIIDSYTFTALKSMGVSIMFHIINDPNGDKYSELGKLQNRDLKLAKDLKADYHLLMPDFVYSWHAFAGILDAASRGYKAIVRLNLSTVMETICPVLDQYRDYEIIEISAADLAALSLLHIHPGFEHWITHDNDYPNAHVIAWEGKEKLHMLSPHNTILYLDRDIVMSADINNPLDGELDKIAGEVYCTKPYDAVCAIEISPKRQRPLESARINIKDFRKLFMTNTNESSAQLSIFKDETIDEINRGMLGDRPYMSDEEIKNAKEIVVNALS